MITEEEIAAVCSNAGLQGTHCFPQSKILLFCFCFAVVTSMGNVCEQT
jgi:hypothetical protein